MKGPVPWFLVFNSKPLEIGGRESLFQGVKVPLTRLWVSALQDTSVTARAGKQSGFPTLPSEGLVLSWYTCHFLQEFPNLFTKKLPPKKRLLFVLRNDFAHGGNSSCSAGPDGAEKEACVQLQNFRNRDTGGHRARAPEEGGVQHRSYPVVTPAKSASSLQASVSFFV